MQVKGVGSDDSEYPSVKILFSFLDFCQVENKCFVLEKPQVHKG
jgi:hypothetical protein